jgi:hypothetical protein
VTDQATEPPAGGLTPVFNEIQVAFALSPNRPEPDQMVEDLSGPTERVLMRNVIDEDSGIVQPSVFLRSDTFADPATGMPTQIVSLAKDSGITESRIFGGEMAVHVRPPSYLPQDLLERFPVPAQAALLGRQLAGRAATPDEYSIGTIQSLQEDSFFPARIRMEVFYSFVIAGRSGKLRDVSSNITAVAPEPHLIEAVVNSVPPDPETVVRAREWNLVDAGKLLKLWIRVESFRFLALGDWQHTRRLAYSG